MTTQSASKISVFCIVTIIAAVIGGQLTSHRSKRKTEKSIAARMSAFDEQKRERNCKWFLERDVYASVQDENAGMDREKIRLYGALGDMCLSLVNLNPEKDVAAEIERKDGLGKNFYGKNCSWFYRQANIEPGEKNMDSEKVNLFIFLGQLCEKQPQTPE